MSTKTYFHKTRPVLLLTILAVSLVSLRAQGTTLQAMKAARDFRQELALSVSQNSQTTAKAIAALRSTKNLSGRALAADADLAHAALDVGHRLLALDRPDAAEEFFRLAEQSFAVAVNRTSQGKERAEILQHLAVIRARYLGKIELARGNIDEAIALQPADAALQETRAALARGHSEQFKKPGKN